MNIWSLLWRVKVVVFQRNIAHNVVVDEGVPLGPEVPWLLLRVVWSILQSRQLILKIQHVVGLLVSKGAVFVFRQDINKRFLFDLARILLNLRIGVDLRYGVVTGLLRLYSLVGDLYIRWRHTLKLRLLINVAAHIIPPLAIFLTLREKDLVGARLLQLRLSRSLVLYRGVVVGHGM